MRNLINESISKFIKENENSGVVIQLKRANEKGDKEAFVLLIEKIRGVMRIQEEIDYHEEMIDHYKEMIKEHKLDIAGKKNELKNEMYYHKIKRVNPMQKVANDCMEDIERKINE
jgi:hypothetical protein